MDTSWTCVCTFIKTEESHKKMATNSEKAPIAFQEDFMDYYTCDGDGGDDDDVDDDESSFSSLNTSCQDAQTTKSENEGLHSHIHDQIKHTECVTIANIENRKGNAFHEDYAPHKVLSNVLSSRGGINSEDDGECNSSTGSRYILYSSVYGSHSQFSKSSLRHSIEGISGLKHEGPEPVILGYVGRRCRECDTLSHDTGQHSSETVYMADMAAGLKMNSSKDVTLDSLVVFNTITGERLLPDGCEQQRGSEDKPHELIGQIEDNRASLNKDKVKDTCMWVLKKSVIFSVSNIGLACIIVCYALLGAVIFQSLEAWKEKEVSSTIWDIRKERMEELRSIPLALGHLKKEAWMAKADKILFKFQRKLYTMTKEFGWDGVEDAVESEQHWSFAGALLYSVTLITTIGYGDITPKTPGGRVATMFYALLGIPLTLLCLANLGNVMAQTFRQLFYRFEFKIENMFSYFKALYKYSQSETRERSVQSMRYKSGIESDHVESDENKSVDGENDDCCIDSDSDNVPGGHDTLVVSKKMEHQTEPSSDTACYTDSPGNETDTPFKSKFIVSQDADKPCSGYEYVGHDGKGNMQTRRCGKPRRKGMSLQQRKRLKKDVPIWVCLLLVIGYNIFGSLLFGLWEGWGFTTGLYFSFITLSTIGFGDVVPGHSIESWQSQEKQVFCTLYLLVGMAMIAMCFGLMQKQIRDKARRCGIRMGLLDKQDTRTGTAV